MLEAEVEIIDPFEMIWYEDKRQENDAMALFAAAKGNMVDDVRVRCEMEGANVNGRTIEVGGPWDWVVGTGVCVAGGGARGVAVATR